MPKYKIKVEDIYSQCPAEKKILKKIAEHVLSEERVMLADINIVLVDDAFIINLNKQYLNKTTTTDVISFNFEEPPDLQNLDGEVYANVEQIRRQAEEYEVTEAEELHRIVIHGLLHLIGYNDASPVDKNAMTEKENFYLSPIQ
ncbi:MAG: rRNA maturation RNase YbeY [Candidatus Zhuqueibacterota bacterium]